MLSTKIDSNFPGVNQNSINWMKHYLNGGDDVGAPWNGICDSVSGYTYNYSNQFEFDVSYSDFSASNLLCTTVVQAPQMASDGTIATYSGFYNGPITYISTGSSYDPVTPTGFDITVFRFPYPDLPGGLLVRPQNARVFSPGSAFAADAGLTFTDLEHTTTAPEITIYNGCFIPILDPNWQPDVINLVDAGYTRVGQLNVKTPVVGISTARVDGSAAEITLGFSEELASWRMAGASLTMSIPVSEYYKNGTLVACTANTPLALQSETRYNPIKIVRDSATFAQAVITNRLGPDICAYDLPSSYSEISSVKNYHKFPITDGVYVVLHNSQGVFNFYNYEKRNKTLVMPSNMQAMQWNTTIYGDSSTAPHMTGGVYGLVIYNNGVPEVYPICTMANKTIYSNYGTKMPIFNIPNSPLAEWDIASISTAINDQDKALQLSLKLNSYVECYISASSSLKPSVSITSPYYPRLLEYLSSFYHEHDGIYPYSWNDGKKVWNYFKKFLSSDALSKMVSTVSPSAGQIVSLIQSEVQRIANKKKEKDSKLTKAEKEQVKSIVSSTLDNKKKKK